MLSLNRYACCLFMKTYFAPRMFDGNQMVLNRLVHTNEKQIEKVESTTLSLPELKQQGVSILQGLLVPGFIDLQINGGGGMQFNHTPTPECLHTMFNAHATTGTSAMFPTVITDDLEVMKQSADAIAQVRAEGIQGIAGVHFEGPHLSDSKKGMHEGKHIRPLTQEEMAIYCRKDVGQVIITVAPETVRGEQIRQLASHGVIVFLGHSNATAEQANEALDAGAIGFTHLFNAMSGFTGRAPGLVGSAMASADAYAGIIADMIHVSPISLQAAYRALGSQRLFMVTDAMAPSASCHTSFHYGDDTIHLKDGKLLTSEGNLAGSVLTLIEALQNAHFKANIPFQECLKMLTSTPARAANIHQQFGAIKPGFANTMMLLDENLNILPMP